MHPSQILPLTHRSGSSPLNCGEPVLSKPDQCTTKAKGLLTEMTSGYFHPQQRSEAGVRTPALLCLSHPEPLQGLMGKRWPDHFLDSILHV